MLTQISLQRQFTLVGLLAGAVAIAGASAVDWLEPLIPMAGGWVAWACVVAVEAAAILWLARTLGNNAAARSASTVAAIEALAEGDLRRRERLDGKDDFAWMRWKLGEARKAIADMVGGLAGNSTQLAAAAEELSTITDANSERLMRQARETEAVASAMTQMSASVHEVARSATAAADATRAADEEARNGARVVGTAVEGISALAAEVERTAAAIDELKEESAGIGRVIEVIRDIAEQTNLLALNAAIEAARAGEQGRGFAVVADEVRGLASRTQTSTQEIQSMIERLQRGAATAAEVMRGGRQKAEQSVTQAAAAGDTLGRIQGAVSRISEMTVQIATAAREQSSATEDVARNLTSIRGLATETSEGSRQVAQATDELARLAVQLQDMVGRFRLA